MVSKSHRDMTDEERIELKKFTERERIKHNSGCLPLFIFSL